MKSMLKNKGSSVETEAKLSSKAVSRLKNSADSEIINRSSKNEQATQLQSITEAFVNNHHQLNSEPQSSTQVQLKSRDTNQTNDLISETKKTALHHFKSDVIQQYPYVGSDPPATTDSQIYGIFKMNNGVQGKCVYVGQTTLLRAGTRFQEHVRDDNWAPWHYGNYSSNDSRDWPYVPRELERLKDVTKFEVTAAEQWWIEHEGGVQKLENRENAMTKKTFNKYKDIDGNYDNTKISVGKTWAPSK